MVLGEVCGLEAGLVWAGFPETGFACKLALDSRRDAETAMMILIMMELYLIRAIVRENGLPRIGSLTYWSARKDDAGLRQ